MATSFFSLFLLLSISLATTTVWKKGMVVRAHSHCHDNECEKTWCVAKPASNEETLHKNIDYACSKVDCGILHPGCPCFYPNNLISHASVAMNLYYQSSGRNSWNCDFKGSGIITKTDPSCGGCHYA
ncbi:CBM43-containing protein [Zostera marina]|uniref:CBM43-containing protein n=1 Tax=Zostera marina TaxID=29655 RepID=A0A0K9NSG7_ZOSMR|nr:CBM43-containing protein [Zostera marina]